MESSLKNKETNSPSLVFHNNLVCLEMMGDLFVVFFPFLVLVLGLFSPGILRFCPPPLPWLNSSARGPLSLAHKSLAKSWVNVWTYPGSKRERKNISQSENTGDKPLIPRIGGHQQPLKRSCFHPKKRSQRVFGGEFVALRVSWWMCHFCWSDSCSESFGG